MPNTTVLKKKQKVFFPNLNGVRAVAALIVFVAYLMLYLCFAIPHGESFLRTKNIPKNHTITILSNSFIGINSQLLVPIIRKP